MSGTSVNRSMLQFLAYYLVTWPLTTWQHELLNFERSDYPDQVYINAITILELMSWSPGVHCPE